MLIPPPWLIEEERKREQDRQDRREQPGLQLPIYPEYAEHADQPDARDDLPLEGSTVIVLDL